MLSQGWTDEAAGNGVVVHGRCGGVGIESGGFLNCSAALSSSSEQLNEQKLDPGC